MDCASSKTLKGKITIADRIAKINAIKIFVMYFLTEFTVFIFKTDWFNTKNLKTFK